MESITFSVSVSLSVNLLMKDGFFFSQTSLMFQSMVPWRFCTSDTLHVVHCTLHKNVLQRLPQMKMSHHLLKISRVSVIACQLILKLFPWHRWLPSLYMIQNDLPGTYVYLSIYGCCYIPILRSQIAQPLPYFDKTLNSKHLPSAAAIPRPFARIESSLLPCTFKYALCMSYCSLIYSFVAFWKYLFTCCSHAFIFCCLICIIQRFYQKLLLKFFPSRILLKFSIALWPHPIFRNEDALVILFQP